jgi:hypothetical protein
MKLEFSRPIFAKYSSIKFHENPFIGSRVIESRQIYMTKLVVTSRRIRCAEHVARIGEKRDVYRILVGKHEGKRQLGRPRHRWEDNNKMDLQEVGFRGMDWIEMARDRDRWRVVVNAAMNLWDP